MEERRVVVTGMGTITSLGLSTAETWDNIKSGKSGIGWITLFDTSESITKIAAQVPERFDKIAQESIKKRNLKQMTRIGQFALIAAREAFFDAGLSNGFDKEKAEVILGATGSGYSSIEAERPGNYIVRSMINSLSAWICIELGLKGANFTVNTACASSAYAFGLAYDRIKNGQADLIITGGTESMITKEGIAGFNELMAISENNDALEKACRPFDKGRDGFVMGEGAGMLVLENYEHAVKREARIYCEVGGYSISSESYNMVAPEKDGNGMARSIKLALNNSNSNIEDIDYINAHGTSTFLNDIYETKAIKKIFKERAYQIPVSSTKSMIGHTLGAAGAIEALVTVRSVYEDIVTPTINHMVPDSECDLDYVSDKARKHVIRAALSNSFGFGGHNCVLVFKKL